jgi:hypothetical protein
MISLGDLVVVIVAVSIVLCFVAVTRRFIQRAEKAEAAED